MDIMMGNDVETCGDAIDIKCEIKKNPVIAGLMECSIADHERTCITLIGEEQVKTNPNNAIIAALCDAVRLAREYVRSKKI